jgi:3-oxoacyl-[acyl-carrier-protein] synthase-3
VPRTTALRTRYTRAKESKPPDDTFSIHSASLARLGQPRLAVATAVWLDIPLAILENTQSHIQELSLTKPIRAKISALGTYLPPRVLTNADLEKMVDTTNEWIMERVGVRERHLADKGVAASDLAVEAVKNLLASHPFDLQQVDLIVVGTVTPDMMYPSTACLVQHKLGIENTWGFDISAGCSGFLYALNTGVKFVESGQYNKVLVIGSDVNSSMTDYTDRAVCIIFGDGAGAVLLEPSEDDEIGVLDHVAQIEGMGGQFLCMPGGGSLNPATHETVDRKMHYIHQDGKNVFRYAVKKMAEMTERILEKNKLTGKDIDCFIAHQANRRIITATADRLRMPLEKVIINIDRFGNTTAGTIPIAMQTALDERRLKKGDRLLIATVGAGFTSGATLLRWAF